MNTTPALRKPRSHDAALLAAVERFDGAHDAFLAIMSQAGELVGDEAGEQAMEDAQAEHDEAERVLWEMIRPGHYRPVARGTRVYLGEHDGRVRVIDEVRRLD